MQKKRFIVTLIINLLISFSVNSIIYRDAKFDQGYVTLAENKAFEAVGQVSLTFLKKQKYPKTERAIISKCTGTLIENQIVLTTASCLELMMASEDVTFLEKQSYFTIKGINYTIKYVSYHEKYIPGKPVPNGQDLALLYLNEPVEDITPAIIYPGNSLDLHDKIVFMVGYGYYGTPENIKYPDDRARAGKQKITDIKNTMLITRFSRSTDIDDQVMFTHIDAGGPTWYFKDGKAYLVAVNSFRVTDSELKPDDNRKTPLGTTGYSTALPFYIAWIDAHKEAFKKQEQDSKRTIERKKRNADCSEINSWSDKKCWRNGLVPDNKNTEFSVKFLGRETVYLDRNIELTKLELDHPQARLEVPNQVKTNFTEQSAEDYRLALGLLGENYKAVEFHRTLIFAKDGIYQIPQLRTIEVRVGEGSLWVNGELFVDTFTISGGSVRGEGEIINSYIPIINSGGTIMPGGVRNLGRLKIVGDYHQLNKSDEVKGGKLLIKVGSSRKGMPSDKLIVQGQTKLGGTLEIRKIGPLKQGAKLIILESPTIEGKFETIVTSPGLDVQVEYAHERINIIVKESPAYKDNTPELIDEPLPQSNVNYAEQKHELTIKGKERVLERIKETLGTGAARKVESLVSIELLAKVLMDNKEPAEEKTPPTQVIISRTNSSMRPSRPSEWGQSANWSTGVVPDNNEENEFMVDIFMPDTIVLDQAISLNGVHINHRNANIFIPGRLPTTHNKETLEKFIAELKESGDKKASEIERSLVVGSEGEVYLVPTLKSWTAQLTKGLLRVDGELIVDSFAIKGGRLTGKGTITATQAINNNGGVVEPGEIAKVGSLKIIGSYQQENKNNEGSSGTLRIKVNKGENGTIRNDILVVQDTLTLGGILEINEIGAPLAEGDSIIIAESMGIEGSFQQVKTRFGLDTAISYTEGQVKIIFHELPKLSLTKEDVKEKNLELLNNQQLLLNNEAISLSRLHINGGELIGEGQIKVDQLHVIGGKITTKTEKASRVIFVEEELSRDELLAKVKAENAVQITVDGNAKLNSATLTLQVRKALVETRKERNKEGSERGMSPLVPPLEAPEQGNWKNHLFPQVPPRAAMSDASSANFDIPVAISNDDELVKGFLSPSGNSLFSGPAFLLNGLIFSGSSPNMQSFEQAQSFCKDTKMARLPTAKEFEEFYAAAKHHKTNDIFYNGIFWTSDSESIKEPNSAAETMVKVMYDYEKGYITSMPSTAKAYVRCVIDTENELTSKYIIIPTYEWNADSIQVNGDLHIQGGELDISYVEGTHFQSTNHFTIIKANSIEGRFDSIRPWPGVLQPKVRYQKDSIELYFEADRYSDQDFNSIEAQKAALILDEARDDPNLANLLKVLDTVPRENLEASILMFFHAAKQAPPAKKTEVEATEPPTSNETDVTLELSLTGVSEESSEAETTDKTDTFISYVR